MDKIVTQKLYKDPESFIYEETFFPYISKLEEEKQLSILPKNLYVYYVMSTLFAEINNGGFLQYLINSSRNSFHELQCCVQELHQERLTLLITEFSKEVSDYMMRNGQDIDSFNSNEEFNTVLETFDNRFYDLDSELHFDKLILKYYKDNFTVKSIKYLAVKEKTSDECSYFTYKCTHDIDKAILAFLSFLCEYNTSWDIQVSQYNIIAFPSKNCLDLSKIVTYFADDSYSYSSNNSFLGRLSFRKAQSRKTILEFGYLKISAPLPKEKCRPGMLETNEILIIPSGFDDNEYKIKQQYGIGFFEESNVRQDLSSYIVLGAFENDGKGVHSKSLVLEKLLCYVKSTKCIKSVFENDYKFVDDKLETKKIFYFNR